MANPSVNFPTCRLSSVVEQRFCKAKVVGSNPSAGFDERTDLRRDHGGRPEATAPSVQTAKAAR